jgi:hypothetical protein
MGEIVLGRIFRQFLPFDVCGGSACFYRTVNFPTPQIFAGIFIQNKNHTAALASLEIPFRISLRTNGMLKPEASANLAMRHANRIDSSFLLN